MAPSNSIAMNVVKRPARAVSFILKSIWAVIILFLVCVLWLTLFLFFLPFLILGELLGLRKRIQTSDLEPSKPGIPLKPDTQTAERAHFSAVEDQDTDHFIFDRRKDVSKLFGCNTRNVSYRWSLFTRRLAEIKSRFKDPKAIDFGAGSLRDSYELSKLGFRVVSVDLDEILLRRYYEFYDWQQLPSAPRLFARRLDDLLREVGAGSFHLAIAFDVIEHLEDPAAYVAEIGSLLKPGGLFFTIVPNRRSLFERYFKHSIQKQRRKGVAWIPGVPHMQFKTPSEWERFFADNGYKVLDHEMAVGPFVNDLWHGLIGLPLTIFVDPVLQVLAYKFRLRYSSGFIDRFYPPWLMERVDAWDRVFKKWLSPRFGWNLIVLQKEAAAN